MIIGLTGTKASGKGEVAEILKGKGFSYSSTSDRVREEAVSRGIEKYTIKQLQDIGNELRVRFGSGVLAERTLQKLEGEGKCVIDGIRNPGEVEVLKREKDFILIAVDAPLQQRYGRLRQRDRESDPKDWASFIEMDRRDRGINEVNSGQQVERCMQMADFRIFNDENLGELKFKIDELLKKFVKRPSWDEYFMKMAALVAERSTCLRHHIGAIIVKNKRVLTTGYNGAARGVKDCLELGCLRDKLEIPSGQRHEICRAIHAEQNAIIQGGLHGINIDGSILYCTHTPCMICAKMIVNAGIKEVVSYQDYADAEAREFLEQTGIILRKIDKPGPVIEFKD